MLIGASLRRTTAVCLKPPDIESRFELALGRVFVAIGTVLGGERRWLDVLLVIATFYLLAGFGAARFCHFFAEAPLFSTIRLRYDHYFHSRRKPHKFQSSAALRKHFVSGSPKLPAGRRRYSTPNAIAAPLKDAGRVPRHAPLVARREPQQRGLFSPGRDARRADGPVTVC